MKIQRLIFLLEVLIPGILASKYVKSISLKNGMLLLLWLMFGNVNIFFENFIFTKEYVQVKESCKIQ